MKRLLTVRARRGTLGTSSGLHKAAATEAAMLPPPPATEAASAEGAAEAAGADGAAPRASDRARLLSSAAAVAESSIYTLDGIPSEFAYRVRHSARV